MVMLLFPFVDKVKVFFRIGEARKQSFMLICAHLLALKEGEIIGCVLCCAASYPMTLAVFHFNSVR